MPRQVSLGALGLACLLAAVSCGNVKQRVKEKVKGVVQGAQTVVASAAPDRPRTDSTPPKIPLGMNLTSVTYYSTQLPFVDARKSGKEFHSMNAVRVPGGKNPWNTGFAEQIPHDANGYPLELPYVVPGAEAPQVVIAPVAAKIYGGAYTLLWDGDGEIEVKGDAKVTPLGPGRARVEVDGDGESWFLSITRSTRGNHVRNIRLYTRTSSHGCAPRARCASWTGARPTTVPSSTGKTARRPTCRRGHRAAWLSST
jgi:hypothetical protein